VFFVIPHVRASMARAPMDLLVMVHACNVIKVIMAKTVKCSVRVTRAMTDLMGVEPAFIHPLAVRLIPHPLLTQPQIQTPQVYLFPS